MNANPVARLSIAEDLLGHSLDPNGFARCPGEAFHNGKTGARDFQVKLDGGAPTGRCFHSSCSAEVEAFNSALRSRIGKAEANRGNYQPPAAGNVARKPLPERKQKRPPFDAAKLAEVAARCPYPIDEAWLAARSPVAIPAEQNAELAARFLDSLYQPGERILIFEREFSQGDYLVEAGKGSFRLGDSPGVKAVRSALPAGGQIGIFFLAQPVTGLWQANPNNRAENGSPKMGRRHGDCVTSWRFLVLESDEAPPALWLRALVQLPMPIVAIYTSGGRSIHALVKVACDSKAEWDSLRDDLVPILAVLGADPAAMTAVRLTRLPGTLRHGARGKDGKVKPYPAPRLQRLLYLNPQAPVSPILELKP